MTRKYKVAKGSKDANFDEKCFLNEGEENQMEVHGFRVRRWSQVVSWGLIVLSLGTLHLIFYWFPKLYLYATHRRCSIDIATTVLVKETEGNTVAYYIRNIVQETSWEESHRENNYAYFNEACMTEGEVKNDDSLSSKIVFRNSFSTEINDCKIFILKNVRYLWIREKRKFVKLSGIGPSLKNNALHNISYADSTLREHLIKIYGKNEITVRVQSYLKLFLIEVLSPYYFLQIFSIIIWILDNYWSYTYAVIAVTCLGIVITIFQTHKAQVKLRKTVEMSEAKKVEICLPDGSSQEISSHDMVPGDRLIISKGEFVLPCDAVILSGTCIVQESMLTGESAPLTKTPLPCTDQEFIEAKSSNHMIYSGTKIIQIRATGNDSRVTALVLRTGFATARGDLVRAILYPPPVDYAFEQSVYTFINLSALGAFAVAIAVIIWMVSLKVGMFKAFVKAFELFAMVIPAAIPGSLTLTKIYAVRRLKKRSISCLNSKVVNVAGSTNCACFDKTGTITEEGLDVKGVVSIENESFSQLVSDVYSMNNERLKFALASCHSLSLNQEDKLIGDPLDIKMFESTSWIFEEVPEESNMKSEGISAPIVYPDVAQKTNVCIRLLHQNQFESELQRMSVITQENYSGLFYLYCKGSPEVIAALSLTHSVPDSWMEVLQYYTTKGYRVIALACKQLYASFENIKLMSRHDLETDLNFLGFLILENKIKTASKPTIELLKKGQFKISMLTGDNMQTAISISRDCKIIDSTAKLFEINEQDGRLICNTNQYDYNRDQPKKTEDLRNIEEGPATYNLALSGKAWEIIRRKHEEYLPNILARTAILARATARHKQQFITELQAIGYCVVMCGDGANDCAALKAANVGVSLSQTEASVASPLSSSASDISCVSTVIQEGRASLVASSGLVQFILCYGYIQFVAVLINYGFTSNFSDYEFIYQDIFLTIFFSLLFSLTEAYQGEISPNVPTTKILSTITLLSLSIHTLIFVAFQFLSLLWIQFFLRYHKVRGDINSPSNYFTPQYTYQNYSVFSMSVFQIIISSIIFSKGHPYRKPIYTNILFFAAVTVMTILTVLLITYPGSWVQQLFVLYLPPMESRYSILSMAVVNFIISYIVETFLIELLVVKLVKRISNLKNRRKRYLTALDETKDMSWLFTNIIETDSLTDLKKSIMVVNSNNN